MESGGTCQGDHRLHQLLHKGSPEKAPAPVLPGGATEERLKGVWINKQGQACLSPLHSWLQAHNESTVLVGSAKDGLLSFYLFILVMLCNLQELSSLTRD